MKKSVLSMALLAAVVLPQVASAQEYDNRWYLSGTAGYIWPDDDQFAEDDFFWGVGIGKRVSENWAIDFEYSSASLASTIPLADQAFFGIDVGDLDAESYELIARRYFIDENRTWNPYLAFGLGSETVTVNYKNPITGAGFSADDSSWMARLGLGVQSERRERVDFRFEAGLRYADGYDIGVIACRLSEVSICLQPQASSVMDYYASASMLVKLGSLPAPVVAEVVAPPAPTCDTLDGDNDGVNDCNDRCPSSTAGQTIGADGCPVKLTIDLKGVNFDFDKATLRPDAVVLLDEAVAVLSKYPELRVEVAGHTDLCGSDGYNQDLSQRRAQTVYDYLTGKGIDAGRLAGSNGYGESRPLEATEQTSPACRSETNRRTELNVQN